MTKCRVFKNVFFIKKSDGNVVLIKYTEFDLRVQKGFEYMYSYSANFVYTRFILNLL